MKKIVVIFVLFIFVFGMAFSNDVEEKQNKPEKPIEFTVSPLIGFGNIASATYLKENWTAFTIGFNLGLNTKNGFTFMLSEYFLLNGKVKATDYPVRYDSYVDGYIYDDAVLNLKGALWEGSALFGYTYKNIKNTHVTAAAGLTLGVGFPKINKINNSTEHNNDGFTHNITFVNFGLPLHVGIKYFFTKKIGIEASITEVLSFGMINSTNRLDGFYTGFINGFFLKFGPVFRF
ncbi:DUF2715 domain-containing protein [Treponema sp. OMZ 788]|uniref:DUF2715 domain-containing protein n=1 Tax=Treponema sp. OMZ 788 TaxID=2563664 RepID=UPI0020A51BC8|nr:DUF2715 domain-containing protein [Treponema sp. OMZ 788]UTC65512.1 DUF2715 domain-containing protein [Treponema sp. OMZ 788]